MKLWSGTLSPFSAKVRIALGEKGIDVELAEVPWSRANLWGPKPAEFLEASPRGEVPALVDGDLAIFDSTIICEYLEETHPTPALMPADPSGKAECRMWEEMADHMLASRITTLIREVFMKPDGTDRDATAVDHALTDFRGYHQALERRLSESDYLCGDYGIADIATFICLGFAQTFGAALDDFPALQHWLGAVQARPVVKREFDAIMAAAAAV